MAELNRFFAIVLVAVGGLLPIVDPLAGAPFFLASTSGLTSEERRTMARSVAINSFLLLIGSILIGSYVLDFLGLSISAVQVGGGLVVCGIAWSLLNAPTTMVPMAGKAPAVAAERDDLGQRAFYPLTMPLTVGPGSISVAITLGANPEQGMRELGMTALAHSVYVCYRYADPILKRVGRVGTSVFMRLSAFILLCIGVQICWNGVHSLLLTVVH